MKHAVPKGDKKKKKQVTSEIAILEVELETKQNEELQEFHAMVNDHSSSFKKLVNNLSYNICSLQLII